MQNEEQAQVLKAFENNAQVDFWSEIRKAGGATTIMVSPAAQGIFTRILNENNMHFEVTIEDVER